MEQIKHEIKRGWYVLRAISGKEAKVKEILDGAIKNGNLGKDLFQVLIPTEKVLTVRGGKKVVKEKNLYSGYVFIEAQLTGELIHELTNTTKTLSEALAKAPGMKIRESGGVGSDMAVTMDGFSGKHVKVFIDGVPQEGVGSSFGLNNIPVNFADRIEIYRGVVPVGFGADAIGGIINIVTPRRQRKWFMDASYSYGSFNTHKSYHQLSGQTLRERF